MHWGSGWDKRKEMKKKYKHSPLILFLVSLEVSTNL